uniref:Ricin B lectin domain-containing protein n=1 Tax=Lotharella oceanica TaxID=641309 RepID=A0A7S2XB56_9EUKA|mmetsp:Transcript_25261/g.47144  ORF Transcript_25261/g.47144 Transcript_25261/m.47144 type:complete len:222 (+) Transcript_25261:35-700(+)
MDNASYRKARKRIKFVVKSYATKLGLGRWTNAYLWFLLLIAGVGLVFGLCALGFHMQKVMSRQTPGRYGSPKERVAVWRDFLRENNLHTVEIVGHVNSGAPRCLDIKDAAKIEGEDLGGRPVQAYNCTGNANQRWSLQQDQSIRSKRNKEYCLGFDQASKDAKMTRCSEQYTRWRHDIDTNKIVTVDANPQVCLEMKNEDGGLVRAENCADGNERQAFMLL